MHEFTLALVGSINTFKLNHYFLLKDCWIWWLVLVAEDSVDDYPLGKSPSRGAASFRQQDTQMDSTPFSNCLRSLIPD